MKSYYVKEKDYYVLHMGVLSTRIPFRLCVGGYTTVNINDDIMDILVHNFNNDCLEWSYDGEVVTEDTIKSIMENNNPCIADFNLTVKGED